MAAGHNLKTLKQKYVDECRERKELERAKANKNHFILRLTQEVQTRDDTINKLRQVSVNYFDSTIL